MCKKTKKVITIKIEVKEKHLENFSSTAIEHLEVGANTYVNDIIKEANLIESNCRKTHASEEVTSTNVVTAIESYRTAPMYNTKSLNLRRFCIIASVFITSIIGYLVGSEYMDVNTYGPKYLITVLVLGFLACIASIYPMIGE